MSDFHLEFNQQGAMDYVRARAVKMLHRAADSVANRARQLLSVAGTAVATKGLKRAGKRFRKGRRIYGAERSKPGEPPRKQHGDLRKRVMTEVDPESLSARVGTNYKVGMYLELGTKRGIAPRPWLRRALAETWTKVNQLLSGMPEGAGDDKAPPKGGAPSADGGK